MKLSDADRAVLVAYVKTVRDRLGLLQWRIEIDHEDADSDCLAQICTTDGRWIAIVKVRHDFRALDAETQRMAIVHELLHIPLDAIDRCAQDLEDALGRETYNLHRATVKRTIELATDAITTAIVAHFPLIDWPKEPESGRTA